MPLVSILMSVRNGAAYLPATLASIANQTLTDYEFLIADDASTDTTPALLQAAAAADPRIRLFPGAGGLGASLASLIPHARGQLLARIDADDLALPHRLATQTAYLQAHPDVILASCWAETFTTESAGPTGRIAPRLSSSAIKATLAFANPIVHPGTMLRASVLTTHNLTYPAIPTVEDYTLWTRLAPHGTFAILPEVLLRYRVHAQSMTATRTEIWHTLTETLQTEYIRAQTGLTPPPVHHAMARHRRLPAARHATLLFWLVRLTLHWPQPWAMAPVALRKYLGYLRATLPSSIAPHQNQVNHTNT